MDAVVIGAGVNGLAAARSLARRGLSVVLLEQFGAAHDRGSSHGGSRIYRLSYPDPAWVRLAQAALPLWRELEAEQGEELLVRNGSLDLGRVEPNAAALAACGAPFELLDDRELEARFPQLAAEPGTTGLHQPDGGILRADRCLTALAASAGAAGAELRYETPVRELRERDGCAVVDTDSGSIECAVAVVAAGAWAPRLLERHGGLAATPTCETVTYFRLELEGTVPSVIDWEHGSDREQAGYALAAPGIGLKAGLHHSGPPTDPDEPGRADAAVAEWTAAWVARRFRGAAATPLRSETCLYTSTIDERFVLERRGPIVVASACSGHGFKFAPTVGERIAELAAPGTLSV